MDDRTERLLQKAEDAIDRNDIDQAEAYKVLANVTEYHRRKEVRDMNRAFNSTPAEQVES